MGSLGSGIWGGITGKGGEEEADAGEGESDSDRQKNSGFFG